MSEYTSTVNINIGAWFGEHNELLLKLENCDGVLTEDAALGLSAALLQAVIECRKMPKYQCHPTATKMYLIRDPEHAYHPPDESD